MTEQTYSPAATVLMRLLEDDPHNTALANVLIDTLRADAAEQTCPLCRKTVPAGERLAPHPSGKTMKGLCAATDLAPATAALVAANTR